MGLSLRVLTLNEPLNLIYKAVTAVTRGVEVSRYLSGLFRYQKPSLSRGGKCRLSACYVCGKRSEKCSWRMSYFVFAFAVCHMPYMPDMNQTRIHVSLSLNTIESLFDLAKYRFWSGEAIPGVCRPVFIRVRTAYSIAAT